MASSVPCRFCASGNPAAKGYRCAACEKERKREWNKQAKFYGLPYSVDAEPVQELIEDLLLRDGISILELERRAGVSEGTLRKIFAGDRKRVRISPTLDRLCTLSDKSLYDFIRPPQRAG